MSDAPVLPAAPIAVPLRAALAGLVALAFVLQAAFVLRYPQPPLFGDPESYHTVGVRLIGAWTAWRAGAPTAEALESIRGVLYFAGPGSVYALLRLLLGDDPQAFRLVFAAVNSLSILGACLLSRRLAGRDSAAVVTAALACLHPSFAVELAKLFPDPVTGACLTWAAVAYVAALQDERPGRAVLAGLLFGAGLLVRPQLLGYTMALLALVGAFAVWRYRRERRVRALAFALTLGLLPATLTWAAIVRVAGQDLREIEALGNFTFDQRYPYGFWQFLDSDGWMGPYRLGAEPYYRALEEDARKRSWPPTSRTDQWAFTARYVAGRADESLLLVLDNAYRLFDRPPNRYKWDFPYSYPGQVAFHRAVMLLAALAVPLLATRRQGYLGVFFVPAVLAVIHGLSYPWPRFVQPALPLLLAAAGAVAAPTLAMVLSRPWFRGSLALVATGLLASWAGPAVLDLAPYAARAGRLVLLAAALTAPFVMVARRDPRGRFVGFAVAAALTLAPSAHELRSPGWHQFETPLQPGSALEQHIAFTAGARADLVAAPEVFLAMDLRVKGGDLSGFTLDLGGRRIPPAEIQSAMPALGEFILPDGPERRGFPQWWVAPVRAEDLNSGGPLVVRVATTAPGITLMGDRFAAQAAWYEGPSFGDSTHVAGIKFDHDADYRLPVRLPLGSLSTSSFAVARDGARTQLRGVLRVRLMTLGSNVGQVTWSPPPLTDRNAVLAFNAVHGLSGSAELMVNGKRALDLRLGALEGYEAQGGAFSLCYRPTPKRRIGRGMFLLSGPFETGANQELRVRYLSRMRLDRRYFLPRESIDLHEAAQALAECPSLAGRRIAPGVGGALDLSLALYPEGTGRWRVASVY